MWCFPLQFGHNCFVFCKWWFESLISGYRCVGKVCAFLVPFWGGTCLSNLTALVNEHSFIWLQTSCSIAKLDKNRIIVVFIIMDIVTTSYTVFCISLNIYPTSVWSFSKEWYLYICGKFTSKIWPRFSSVLLQTVVHIFFWILLCWKSVCFSWNVGRKKQASAYLNFFFSNIL